MSRRLHAVGEDEPSVSVPAPAAPVTLLDAVQQGRREILARARAQIAMTLDAGVPVHALGRLVGDLLSIDAEIRALDAPVAEETPEVEEVETSADGSAVADEPFELSGELVEVARHLVVPSGIVSTAWPAVEAVCREFGDEFDEAQRGIGQVVLGKRADGIYACTVGGVTLSLPRQVFKTWLVGRILFALCVLFPGLRVVWTAHRGKTSTNTFRVLKRLAARPAAAKHIAFTHTANGEEIGFVNGSLIMFGAREQGFGRGFEEVDVLVFDEAQILSEKALEDLVATTMQAKHPHGALIFYMGTPPRPIDPGEAFAAKRDEALKVEKARDTSAAVDFDGLYVECSADPDADPDDRAQWAKANPSYPHRTPERSMLRLRKNLPSIEAWRREAYGIWDDALRLSRIFTASTWALLGVAEAPTPVARAYGVAFSADGHRTSLGGAAAHDGGAHVELIDWSGDDVEARLVALADWFVAEVDGVPRWRRSSGIVIAGRAGSATLAQLLRERRVSERRIILPSSIQFFDACAMFENTVRDAAAAVIRKEPAPLTHLAAPERADESKQGRLDESVVIVTKRKRGTVGGWSFEPSTEDGDETPVEAVSLALWGVRTLRRPVAPMGTATTERRRGVIL